MTDNNQPPWATYPSIHMPESTSEMFIYYPVGDHDATWLTAVVDYDDLCPLRLELFTPDNGPIGLSMSGRGYDHQMRLDEGSSVNLSFVNVDQRKAFFRLVVELAAWIKEHHSDEVSAV